MFEEKRFCYFVYCQYLVNGNWAFGNTIVNLESRIESPETVRKAEDAMKNQYGFDRVILSNVQLLHERRDSEREHEKLSMQVEKSINEKRERMSARRKRNEKDCSFLRMNQ